MILADTNFWLALSLSKHQFHAAAGNWFAAQSQRRAVLFCRATQQSLLRLLTTDAVMRAYSLPCMTNLAAWSFYAAMRADVRIGFASEPPGIESRWKQYASRDSASPKLWMDAYLAALAVEGGYRLLTIDLAFKQFSGLEVVSL